MGLPFLAVPQALVTAACAVTPEPPEVATGTVTQALCVPCAAVPVPPALPAVACGEVWLALACAKYPVAAAVPAISATAVQFDMRRTRRRPPLRPGFSGSMVALLVSRDVDVCQRAGAPMR